MPVLEGRDGCGSQRRLGTISNFSSRSDCELIPRNQSKSLVGLSSRATLQHESQAQFKIFLRQLKQKCKALDQNFHRTFDEG